MRVDFITVTRRRETLSEQEIIHPLSLDFLIISIQRQSKTPSSCEFRSRPIQAAISVYIHISEQRTGTYRQSDGLKHSRSSSDCDITSRTLLIEQRSYERWKSLSGKHQGSKGRSTFVGNSSSELYKSSNGVCLQLVYKSWRRIAWTPAETREDP
jgi:hypothetical protein